MVSLYELMPFTTNFSHRTSLWCIENLETTNSASDVNYAFVCPRIFLCSRRNVPVQCNMTTHCSSKLLAEKKCFMIILAERGRELWPSSRLCQYDAASTICMYLIKFSFRINRVRCSVCGVCRKMSFN